MTHRIVMTADAVGGIWTYAVDLAAALADRGVTTTLAVLGPAPDAGQRAAAASVPDLRLVMLDAALDWTASGPDEIAAAGRAVAHLAMVTGADLVHLNHPALAAEAAFGVPVVAVAHSCVATWWRAVHPDQRLPDDLAWRARLVSRGYRRASAVLVPTQAFALATAASHGPDLPLHVVRNGRADGGAPRRRERAPFLLAAGRLWDEGKGAALLDDVAARLPVPIIAAGPLEGPNGASVTFRHAEAAGPLGQRALDELYRTTSAFLAPGRYEPFGLAVLEAAQRGAPLILADIASYRELWDDAALFVLPGDVDGFARAAGHVLSNGAVAEALGRAARRRAKRYTVDEMASGTLAAHRKVLEGADLRETAA